jgi:DNA-binding SARP family transcriptional activator
MWASLLGPVTAEAAGTPLALGGLKQRAVFAMLALHPGRVVPLDRLVDELWPEEPPSRATLGLQSYVSRLRRVLAAAAGADADVPRIVTRPPGWLLDVDPQLVDVSRFENILAGARKAAGAAPRPLLDEALSLWRGEPLADLQALSFARDEAARLTELRLTAQELSLEAALAAGDALGAAEEAREFVRANPFRERGWTALMLALYRSGRQSEALAAAARLRRTLADELGIDPSPQTQAAERRILQQDPDLTPAPPAATSAPAPATSDAAPRNDRPLGREEALAAVDAAIAKAARRHGALLVLEGSAGAGKTTLLRAIADRVAEAGGSAVQGSGVGAGAVPALWPWVTIVRDLALLLPADAAPGPEDAAAHALQVMRAGGPAEAPTGSRTRLYRGVVDLLLAARRGAPLAVVLDDLQWVDADTLTLLALAVDQLVGHGVVFAAAVRTGEAGTDEALATLHRVRREALVRMPLPALGVEDVAEVVRRLGGPPSDGELATAIHERTRGNPFFVGELVRLLVSERRLEPDDIRDALPVEVEEVLRRRLDRLPQQTVALLTVVAMAGGPVDVETLVAVTGLDGDAVLDACESALVAELLVEEGPRFALSHDLVRQTVERGVSAARRARLHARLADAVRARPALTPQDVVDVARHLTLAEPVVGPAAAIPYLVSAADDALSRHAHRETERLLEQALDLASRVADPTERAGLAMPVRGKLAIVRTWSRGVLADGGAAGEEFVTPPGDAVSTTGWIGALITSGVTGRYDEVVNVAERVLAGAPAPAARAGAHFVAGWGSLVAGRIDDADRHLQAFEQLDEGTRELRQVAANTTLDVSAAGYAALAAHARGDEADADRLEQLTRSRARGLAQPNGLEADLHGAWLAAMRGHAERTRLLARTCLDGARRFDYPLFGLHASVLAAWADAILGDPQGAQRTDDAYAESEASGIRMFAPLYLLLCAEAHVARGRREDAAERIVRARLVSGQLGDVPSAPRLLALADDLVPGPLQASRKP